MRVGWGAILLLAALILALPACAPKRVTSAGVVTGPGRHESPRSASRTPEAPAADEMAPPTNPELAGALPGPEPLVRSGTSVLAGKRTPPAAITAATGERAVALAKAQLGKPYQWGAAGPDRFDCSGLVQYVYSNLGVPLPRVASQQAGSGVHVDRKDLAPGDLVFFRLNGSRIDHVGIYVGKGRFIHAPNKRRPVQVDSLNDSWWRRKFKGGRRVG